MDTGTALHRIGLWVLFYYLLVPSSSAAGEILTLEQSADRTRVRVETPTEIGSLAFTLALPSSRLPRLRVVSQRWVRSEESELVGEDPGEAVSVSPPVRVRGVWRATVRIRLLRQGTSGRVDRLRSAELLLDHPAVDGEWRGAPRFELDDPARYLRTAGLVNPLVARGYRRASLITDQLHAKRATAGDTFSRAKHWLRLELAETGVYRIRFEELELLMQDDAASIDPHTLRLLSAGNVLQALDAGILEQSWEADQELVERAIHLSVSSPETGLGPGDEILFYAPGVDTWMDRHDPGAAQFDHLEHEFSDRIAFWLCWDRLGESDQDFASAPQRMTRRDARIQAASPRELLSHRERLHVEDARAMRYGVVEDNWTHNLIPVALGQSLTVGFLADQVVSDSTAQLFVEPICLFEYGVPRLEAQFNGLAMEDIHWAFAEQMTGVPLRFEREVSAPTEGTNRLELRNRFGTSWSRFSPPSFDLDLIDVSYRRWLRLREGKLEWRVAPEEFSVADTVRFTVQIDATTPGESEWTVLDTTNPWFPVFLEGATVQAQKLRFETPARGAIRPSHFAVYGSDAILSPLRVELGRPRLLRSEVFAQGGWDYLIVGPEELLAAFEDLAVYHQGFLRDAAGVPLSMPRVALVGLQDVWDNFGHGVKEPAALRNFLKFSYQHPVHGEPGRLTEYLVLAGDASRDYQGRLPVSSGENERDRCPTFIQTHWPAHHTIRYRQPGYVPYATDDWFGAFDSPSNGSAVSYAPYDLGELAVGRAPVASYSEGVRLTARWLEYQREPEFGLWRDEVLLVCDDNVALASNSFSETFHILEGELLESSEIPSALDVQKLYLTQYPNPPGPRNKPAARAQMRRSWSEGKLIVHYIGHGSPKQLADEKVFLIEDVGVLANGNRRPLFLAFSCDVAVYDSPHEKSMSELLVLTENGGAIATIAASQVTFVGSNNALSREFYRTLFPTEDPAADPAPAVALRDARVGLDLSSSGNHNSLKYAFFGDPALRLAVPRLELDMTGSLADSMSTGSTGELVASSPGGSLSGQSYRARFREAREQVAYTSYHPILRPDSTGAFTIPDTIVFHIDYVLEGASFFEGGGRSGADTLVVEAPIPTQLRTGPDASALVLVQDAVPNGSPRMGSARPIPIRLSPSTGGDEDGPLIHLEFSSSSSTVVPGDTLLVTLTDPSGISVLGTTPASRITLDFDDSGFRLDLTDLFRVDDNRFDRGTLRYPLPVELASGHHRLLVSASDTRGNVSSVSMDFELRAAGELSISQVLVVPNPVSRDARFVLDLSAAADVAIQIHSVDGRRIRRLEVDQAHRGTLVIPWDGLDFRGDEIANGAYIFTVQAEFHDEAGLRLTAQGRLVKMR